jgi:hypothetical protein
MVNLNPKGRPIILMINGELFDVKEISRNPSSTKTGQKNPRFLTIKATNITGKRKLTIHLDPRLIRALKDESRSLSYIH